MQGATDFSPIELLFEIKDYFPAKNCSLSTLWRTLLIGTIECLDLPRVLPPSSRGMSASDTFSSGTDLALRFLSLRQKRRDQTSTLRDQVVRKPLSRLERQEVFKKTGGRCHVCGGAIEGAWEADHVFSHSLGGQHESGNYLPAHPICNNYRWFYGTEEFQWILKLGVWLRTQIEKETVLGGLAARAFCAHERTRAGRRVSRNTESDATET
jgi:hypothetical protein